MTRALRTPGLLAAAVVVIVGLNLLMLARTAPGEPLEPGVGAADAVVAGAGLVEPRSESIRVAAQVGGQLAQVLVEEGDSVTAGQVLAVLVNEDLKARLASARAEVAARKADARRVGNGARAEERRQAAAEVRQAEADLEHARADHVRARQLFDERVISRAEMDRADQALRVQTARVEALRERSSLIEADAREEDRTRAAADVALAEARLREADAMLDKTFVRSPIAGIVLRRHVRVGESVSTQFDSPIVTLADRSAIRVRMDVDEADVSKVRVGQAAYVTADAFGDRRFAGHVVRVGQVLGRKHVRTDEPTERVDQKVLETLIELEDGRELPIGLRVRAFLAR